MAKSKCKRLWFRCIAFLAAGFTVIALTSCGSGGGLVNHPAGSGRGGPKAPSGFTWTIRGASISLGQSKKAIEQAIGEVSASNPEIIVSRDGSWIETDTILNGSDPFKEDFSDMNTYRIKYQYETAGGFEIVYNRFGDAISFTTARSSGIGFLGLTTGLSEIEDVYNTLVAAYGESAVGTWEYDRYRYTVNFDTNGNPMDFNVRTSDDAALKLNVSFYDGKILSSISLSWSEGEV